MTRYEIQKKLHVTQLQKNKVETAVMDCVLMAQKRFPGSKIPFPEIRYDLIGTSGGQAIYNRYGKTVHTIRVNPVLLNENEKEIVEQTVPHEMAHVVVSQVWKHERGQQSIKGHGLEWKSVMRLFGLSPNRCHNMDVTTIRVIKGVLEYHFNCGCVGMVYKLSKTKYNRYVDGVVYRCRKCGVQLKFDKKVNL